MPSSCDPFRQNHKRFVVDTMLDQFEDISNENFFMSIGKITSWADTSGGDIPTGSVDTIKDETDFWRGMIAAKRINRSDVSLVIRRVDWETGAIYSPYRDNIDLFHDIQPANFYVLVDDERVYVCIDNNSGVPSLYPPTHTDIAIRKLADGYRWKFLYQIPESKRKFLTKSRTDAIGYIPVEFVHSLQTNDDRSLQWNVQQSAIPGKIEFAYANKGADAYWVTTASCIHPSSNNLVLGTVPAGATTVQIFSSSLNMDSGLYNNMVFSIDGGAGQGQRRLIKSFTPIGATEGGAMASVYIDPLVLGLSGTQDSTKQSYFSIQPKVTVFGDGRSYNNTNNPTTNTAEFFIKFGATSGSTGACSLFQPRFFSSIEVVDGGQDYTFAELGVIKGLTTISSAPVEFRDFSANLRVVIPPIGGHGANAPRELGSSAYMITKDYIQNESGKINTNNDFRQFGILRNPLLRKKQVRIKFHQPGLTGTFLVGGTAGSSGGPIGTVLSWNPGITGMTATSELVLGEIRGETGTFALGGVMNTLTIFNVDTKTFAGTEGRHLLRLTMVPYGAAFDSSGTTYRKLHFAYGVGDIPTNISPSRSSGEIHSWEPSPATNMAGFLYLENPKGNFIIGEGVIQTPPHFIGSNGMSGNGKISAITTALVNTPTTYDLTTALTLVGENFLTSTFNKDVNVSLVAGLTSANGYVINWTSMTGGTQGHMLLGGVQGTVLTGQSVTVVGGASAATTGLVQSIGHLSDLKYRSGEVLYIQNIKPITRNLEQREEIKLVIEL